MLSAIFGSLTLAVMQSKEATASGRSIPKQRYGNFTLPHKVSLLVYVHDSVNY